jgi:preprotein translocase subunit YajC
VNGAVMMIFYVLLFVAIFYFLAVRPQRRQKAQHSEMMRAMKKGDEVVTVGGMFGTVRKMGDDWVELEVAPRTRIRFLKRSISTITQAPDEDEEEYIADEEYEDAEETGQLEAGEDEEYTDEADDEAEGEEEVYDEGTEEDSEEAEDTPAAEETPAVGGGKRRRK